MEYWTRGPIIGRGSTATVSLAATASGELLAVKSTELSCSTSLQKEKCLISQLSSPYIVKYVGCDMTTEFDKPMYNLFMEYVPGGTLSDQVKQQGGTLEESVIRIYAYQILQGLNYLHQNRIVHCDIKGQNVLIGREGAKIGDFGFARKVEMDNGNGIPGNPVISGTPVFMAPEVARGEEQGFPADIWALGCTIIEIATGFNPWPDMSDPVSALYRIGYSGDLPEFPSWLSNVAKDFLSKCLMSDAKQRWTAEQLVQHQFFHGMVKEERAEFIRNSPTTVLDQGFWDSMEVPESSQDSSHIVFSMNFPADRIKHLNGDSEFPNWTEDGDWVTVRNIGTEAVPQISQQNQNSNLESQLVMEPNLASIGSQYEFVSSVSIDDTLPTCLGDEISNTGGSSTMINLMLLSSDNVKDDFDSVLIILYFQIIIMDILLMISSKISLAISYIFMFLSSESVLCH